MSASSERDEEWSIISSSSDVDDEPLLLSMHGGKQKNKIVTVQLSGTAGTGQALGGVPSTLEESAQEGSTYTINGMRDSISTSQTINPTFLTESRSSSHFPGSVNNGTAVRGGDPWVSAREPLVTKMGTQLTAVTSRIDAGVRFVSAMTLDATIGMIISGLRRSRLAHVQAAKAPKGCHQRSAGCVVDSSIRMLEALAVYKEVWLYLLTLAAVTAWSIIMLHRMTVPKEPSFGDQFRIWTSSASWRKFYLDIMYEDGPKSWSLFGFGTSGPKRLRLQGYFSKARNGSKQSLNHFKQQFARTNEFMAPYICHLGEEAMQLSSQVRSYAWNPIWDRVKLVSEQLCQWHALVYSDLYPVLERVYLSHIKDPFDRLFFAIWSHDVCKRWDYASRLSWGAVKNFSSTFFYRGRTLSDTLGDLLTKAAVTAHSCLKSVLS